jgi:hypothetical protein
MSIIDHVNKSVNLETGEVTKTGVAARAERITQLMKEGKSLEQALELTAHMESKVVGNRIEYIKGLQTLSAVRKARHSAQAKLSKARQAGNKQSIARYEAEVQAANARYNELMAKINKSDDPIKAAIEMGERPSQLTQQMVVAIESELKTQLEQVKKVRKWTNQNLKDRINAQPTTTPQCITERLRKISDEVRDLYEARLKGGDKRVETINRRMNLVLQLKKEAESKK